MQIVFNSANLHEISNPFFFFFFFSWKNKKNIIILSSADFAQGVGNNIFMLYIPASVSEVDPDKTAHCRSPNPTNTGTPTGIPHQSNCSEPTREPGTLTMGNNVTGNPASFKL